MLSFVRFRFGDAFGHKRSGAVEREGGLRCSTTLLGVTWKDLFRSARVSFLSLELGSAQVHAVRTCSSADYDTSPVGAPRHGLDFALYNGVKVLRVGETGKWCGRGGR